MNSESVDSGDETEYFDEERYLKEREQRLEEKGLKVTYNAQRRKNISRPVQPRSNAHSNGALNHTQPMQQLPNNSVQTVTVIWTIVLTLFVVVFVLKASCECTCTLHL